MPLLASDILEVGQAKYRYAYALDTRDWELYRSLLADQVIVDFRGLGYRGEPRQRSREWWVGQVRGLLDGFDVTQHVMSSPLVEEAEDGVALTVYLQAHHRLNAGPRRVPVVPPPERQRRRRTAKGPGLFEEKIARESGGSDAISTRPD